MNKDGIIKRLYKKEDPAELMRPSLPWEAAVGQRYRVEAKALHTSTGGKVKVVGTVVWIHPKGRFALLRYRGKAGMQRECYHPMELTERNRVS